MNTPNLAQQILSSPNPEKEVNKLIHLIAFLHKENYKLKSNGTAKNNTRSVR